MTNSSGDLRILYIKNMVCPRCIAAVSESLVQLGMTVKQVELGKAEVIDTEGIPSVEINRELGKSGFELLEGKEQQKVEQIKNWLIHYLEELEGEEPVANVSDYLSQKMHYNYTSLSKLFSEQEEVTIEKYLIHLKIERVKELLSYDEWTLSEIAWRLKYSSVQYLSNQFRQVTGMSVTDYKKASESFRRSLDSLNK